MAAKGKEAVQRLLAIIVIVAMMTAMGIPVPVIFFFAIVIYFVWRAVQHTERQETNRVFDFYVSANDILRDDERRWYGFEIAAVTNEGERIAREMPDAPPLIFYTLGALYRRAGDEANAVENFARLNEAETGDESRRVVASPELRRYVEILRRLERDPAERPQTLAAVRGLERARRQHARTLLDVALNPSAAKDAAINPPAASSPKIAPSGDAPLNAAHASNLLPAPASGERRGIEQVPSLLTYIAASHLTNNGAPPKSPAQDAESTAAPTPDHLASIAAPRPPISELLRDLYEEEKKTA